MIVKERENPSVNTMEWLQNMGKIYDYACDESEDGCFYWVQTLDEEWQPLPTYLEINKEI
jgi:hypothetical protein